MGRLTKEDRRLIRSALNDAMDDRASFADAYGNRGPEAGAALALIAEYEALHVRMFGIASARKREIARIDAIPTVTVQEMSRRAKAQPGTSPASGEVG